jgi:hypothetical protein
MQEASEALSSTQKTQIYAFSHPHSALSTPLDTFTCKRGDGRSRKEIRSSLMVWAPRVGSSCMMAFILSAVAQAWAGHCLQRGLLAVWFESRPGKIPTLLHKQLLKGGLGVRPLGWRRLPAVFDCTWLKFSIATCFHLCEFPPLADAALVGIE